MTGQQMNQWRSKVGVGPCAKIPKGPLIILLTGYICNASKQPPNKFWVPTMLGRCELHILLPGHGTNRYQLKQPGTV